jgi:CBS-domain-containing membrane protein
MRFYFTRMRSKDICPPRQAFKKIIWSWIGAFFGIYLVASLAFYMSDNPVGSMFVIGSFGASAVLVYGAPLAEFSQPRNLIGGSVLSALIGVAVYQVFTDYIVLACALAVSLSIAIMYITRTLHPPGGATALIAVIGGENVHQLGFLYALTPVFLGSLLLLLVALVVNNLSTDPKRHYPVYWM